MLDWSLNRRISVGSCCLRYDVCTLSSPSVCFQRDTKYEANHAESYARLTFQCIFNRNLFSSEYVSHQITHVIGCKNWKSQRYTNTRGIKWNTNRKTTSSFLSSFHFAVSYRLDSSYAIHCFCHWHRIATNWRGIWRARVNNERNLMRFKTRYEEVEESNVFFICIFSTCWLHRFSFVADEKK